MDYLYYLSFLSACNLTTLQALTGSIHIRFKKFNRSRGRSAIMVSGGGGGGGGLLIVFMTLQILHRTY